MSRTITAMFDSRSEADAALDQLRATTGADARIIDETGESSESSDEGAGFWAGLKDAFMPDEDRSSYEEGVRRGGFLLCATVDESKADEACSLLQSSGSVDFDSREKQWRSEGWSSTLGQQDNESRDRGESGSKIVEEERIPIMQEELRVSKREVSRGGAHVRSFVRETPVNEQVNLREENVSVERRPVVDSGPMSARDLDRTDLMKDQVIEMRATGEEAVIGKTAKVTEELVIKKTAGDRTEDIQDTVRHTEVEVDEGLKNQDSETTNSETSGPTSLDTDQAGRR
ncbi:MAG: YsnF/AvaK domain-containing protein [Acidobacteria bacterium]|nr:YsnF/AvaK domain-containing protein [Acidobacteriota bacterium]